MSVALPRFNIAAAILREELVRLEQRHATAGGQPGGQFGHHHHARRLRYRNMVAPGRRTILHVTPYYPPHVGGLETVVRGMAEAQAESDIVEVLTTNCGAEREPSTVRSANLTVRRLRAIELLHTPVAPGLLLRILRAPRHAVVHVHAAMPLTPEIVWLASSLRRTPFVIHVHGIGYPRSRFGRWLYLVYTRTILGHTLRAASRVVVLTDEQAQLLARDFRICRTHIAVVPNAVDAPFHPAPRSEHRKPGPCRLLFVGRIHPVKAIPRLIRAIALMQEAVDTVIVGDGPGRLEVERVVHELHLGNVQLVGVQQGDELHRWHEWADVFVLPSESEGMPLAMLEAMAAGLPVVATDVAGSRETLGDAGVLAALDPPSLAAALDRVAGDSELRDKLGAQSLIRAQEYSWERLTERLERVYTEVMS